MTVEYIQRSYNKLFMVDKIQNLFLNGTGLCSHMSGLFPQVWFMLPYAALIMDAVPTVSNVQSKEA